MLYVTWFILAAISRFVLYLLNVAVYDGINIVQLFQKSNQICDSCFIVSVPL